MTIITHKLFTFLLHSGAQFYGLHFEFMEKETRKQELCLRRLAASGLGCLLSCRTTSQRITSKQQLPAADGGGGWWLVVCSLIPFFPSFLCYPCCTERVAVMTTFMSAIIHDLCSQFLLRVPTSSRHIQCNFAFTHFLQVAVGCSVILGRIAPALLQATTEGSIT